MVSKCANPKCDKPFRKLKEGHIFGFQRKKRVEHFWLCAHCSAGYTLRMQQSEVVLVKKHPHRAA